MNAKAISEKSQNSLGGCVGLAFGSIFAAAGTAFLVFMFIIPTLKSRAAQNWETADCKILSSRVKTHHDSDGNTYSAEISYEYVVDGQRFESDQYSFLNASFGRGRAQKIVRQYPAGSTQTCFFEPGNPENVVLDRNNNNLNYWFTLIPIVFMLVGGGIMFAGIWSWFRRPGNSISGNVDVAQSKQLAGGTNSDSLMTSFSSESSSKPFQAGANELTEADVTDQEWAPPRKLKVQTSRKVMFFGMLGVSIFWNGIVSIFVYNLFDFGNGFDLGRVFMGLFLIPFVLIGILMLAGVVYFFLSLFNPTVEIAISAGAIPLGGEFDLAWEIEGKVERIKKLTIEIHGTQSATYTRGTDTVTETELFEKIPVAVVEDAAQIAFGSVAVQIPADTMHTFEASRNKILWTIEVHGDIPWSPDISESYPFRVAPGPIPV